MLNVQHVSGGYAQNEIIKNISLSVKKGEFFGILGPNGSGKTTLLKMISGLLPFRAGSIYLKGINIHNYSKKSLAQVLAILPQLSMQTFSYTVFETVALGRYAHQKGIFHGLIKKDLEIIQRAMEQTNISQFQNRFLTDLSGGEQQRVFLAQALAQEPDILLLDEPTNHLDLAHQKELLDLLKASTKENRLTVVSIFHDLNLASLYCDKLLLLHHGETKIMETPDMVLTESIVKDVYDTDVKKHPHSEVPKPQLHLLPATGVSKSSDVIKPSMLDVGDKYIAFTSPQPLRTISSGVSGSGIGWHTHFVNRHVQQDYQCENHQQDMKMYLTKHGFSPNDTVSMMTSVPLKNVSYRFFKVTSFSMLIVVTAGVKNAMDSARAKRKQISNPIGSINIWILINGHLTDEAFIQAVITAVEAKTKVLQEMNVLDPVTNTIATGTSTDSVLIAATQQGAKLPFAGTATELGVMIGKGVYSETMQSISNP